MLHFLSHRRSRLACNPCGLTLPNVIISLGTATVVWACSEGVWGGLAGLGVGLVVLRFARNHTCAVEALATVTSKWELALRDASGQLLGSATLPGSSSVPEGVETGSTTNGGMFSRVLNSSAVLAWSSDSAGQREYFSRAWTALTGLSTDQLVTSGWKAAIHPSDLATVESTIEQALRGKTRFEMVYRIRSVDRSYCSLLEHAEPCFDDSGDLAGWIGSCADITSRELIRRALQDATAYLQVYQKIVERHAIVAETDAQGVIIRANERFCRISGYSESELLGQNHRMLNSGVHPKSMWTEVFRTALKKGLWQGEVCNRAKDGSLYWVYTTIAPLLDGDNKVRGYFAIRADISALKTAQVQAEAANRAKTEFLANMSHEIRTPMTAILGYSGLLLEEPEVAECPVKRLEAIRTIERNGKHLLAVINDILDLSRIEAGRMSIELLEFDLSRLIEDVVSLIKVRADEKGLSLDVVIDSQLPRLVWSDPTRLRQILLNLIGNAIKFTEAGGVKVSALVDERQTDVITVDVLDSGIGLTAEQINSLFRPFSQADTSTSRQFGGTGLGLAISRRLAELLGGNVSIAASTPAKGSTFRLTFRWRAPNELLRERNQSPTTHEGTTGYADDRLRGCRVLLAEDGVDNQRLITYFLQKAGAEVTVVTNGQEAVSAALESVRCNFPFDLILMDMQMPVLDGYQATLRLREQGYSLPIVALTAHSMAKDRDKCLNAGCDDFITKPIERRILIERVARSICPSSLVRLPSSPIE